MKLITADVASEMLNIRVQRLYELVRLRAIPFVKLGVRQLRFDPEELEIWAKQGGASAIKVEAPDTSPAELKTQGQIKVENAPKTESTRTNFGDSTNPVWRSAKPNTTPQQYTRRKM